MWMLPLLGLVIVIVKNQFEPHEYCYSFTLNGKPKTSGKNPVPRSGRINLRGRDRKFGTVSIPLEFHFFIYELLNGEGRFSLASGREFHWEAMMSLNLNSPVARPEKTKTPQITFTPHPDYGNDYRNTKYNVGLFIRSSLTCLENVLWLTSLSAELSRLCDWSEKFHK